MALNAERLSAMINFGPCFSHGSRVDRVEVRWVWQKRNRNAGIQRARNLKMRKHVADDFFVLGVEWEFWFA